MGILGGQAAGRKGLEKGYKCTNSIVEKSRKFFEPCHGRFNL
jgi:hypothetical protein